MSHQSSRARRLASPSALALLAMASFAPASAHVTLETPQAPVGTSYKAVLRIPHGCGGATTTSIRVQIPEGVIAVKPSPKPGWTLNTTTGDYKQTYEYYGTKVSKGVTEIAWSGGSLPDAWYDEFVFRAYLARSLKPDTTLYIPIVQGCEGGATERWIEIPAAGKTISDYKHPAPALHLKPPGAGEHGH
jgi:uncharacterized protein YcnI